MVTQTILLTLLGCGSKAYYENDSGDAAVAIDYPDADSDGIIDHHEGGEEDDFDGDGTPNYLDTDSDNDGLDDRYEAGDDEILTFPVDSDSDGSPDYLDTDSDDNCIPDSEEMGMVSSGVDTDGDGVGDTADLDNDGDGILDTYEMGDLCAAVDSDLDGTPDYMDIDSDGDGVGDVWEAGTSEFDPVPEDTDGDGTPDYLDLDSDGDSIPDDIEGGVSDPAEEPKDTDGDGIYDFADRDSDGDGLSDDDEQNIYGTNPYSDDSDGDGYTDGAEVQGDSDPNDNSDGIEGIYVEVPEREGTDEPFYFTLDIQMGDVGFVIDTTGSMSSTISSLTSEFSTLVSEISLTIPDAEYGVAEFDDYYYGGYGGSGDTPFRLIQQITDNAASVQSALGSLYASGGADGPESGMEALYQALSGRGYDQNCNGSFDGSTDVLPFIADPSDPFGGYGGESNNPSNSGGGTEGGMGFRDYALPIIVYAIDNYLRDPDGGYGAPNGCWDAGSNEVVTAALDRGAYLIGIGAQSSIPLSQMYTLADMTGSYADTDGDGMADDRLVFQWTGSSSSFRTTIVNAIQDLVDSVRFSEVTLEIEGDEWGFVTGIDPERYIITDKVSGEEVSFQLSFTGTVAQLEYDQYFTLTLNVIGDGTVLLDTQDITIVVPGTSY